MALVAKPPRREWLTTAFVYLLTRVTPRIIGITAAFGKMSAKNAGASKLLHAQSEETTVCGGLEWRIAINPSAVDQGGVMLQAMRSTLGGRVVPSEYTPE